jgi:ankyrin repeat protein
MVAAVRGNVNCMARLLAAGAPPNEATSKMYLPAQERGVTALMCASSGKGEMAPECVEIMLRAGAAIDTQDVAGLTALAHAVLAENPEVVELLMRYGADTSLQDRTGRSAVDHAIEIRARHREEEQAAAAAGEAYEPPYKGRSIADMLLYSDAFTLSALS